ncbi:hypothetical protein SAMN05660666_02502 [Novosphingobium aromaticivorans]|nr:hypothetical protein [Novosphingobium aromaticivorans]SCY69259.1 hypothetical protein SAMN05660666_02502 [Novosphingobium aromaticivorans]
MVIKWGGRGFGHSSRKQRLTAPAPPSYSAEATAYFAAMSVQPDATRKSALDTLIASLKSAGVWAKLDWLTVHAAHDEQAARVNAVNPAQVASVGVAPTFTTDRGYTGNGTTQYLNTGWNPSSAGGKFTQNDCFMGMWAGTDVTSGAQYDCGNSNATINGRSGATSPITAQSAASSTPTLPVSTSIGFTSFTRTSSTAGVAYKNGASMGAISSTSTTLRNASFLICAANSSTTGTVTAANFSTRRNQALCWGQGLSGAEQLALYNALATYMTAVGA